MLSVDIRSLESKAAQVEGDLAADDPVWQEGDVRPADAVHVTGRLSGAGRGRWYFSGHVGGTVVDPCRRCLEDVTVEVEQDVNIFLAEEGDETAQEDPDVYRVDPRAQSIDLRPAIREEWVLSAPAFVLCREDCKGLCPTCGADLNAGPCSCPQTTDSRWAALREARTDLSRDDA
jgi:uncharacterized protein